MASLLTARGLHTLFNELSEIPAGALLQALNTVIDRNGVIEPRRGITQYKVLPTPTDRAETLLEYKDTLLAQHGSSLAFNTAGVFIDFKDTFSPPQAGRRMRAIEANSNYFLTTSEGVKKLSNVDGNFITSTTFAPGVVNTTDDTITFSSGHNLQDNDILTFSSTGTLPGGLSATSTYYAVVVSSTVIQVSSTPIPFTIVNLTTQGTGTHTLNKNLRVRPAGAPKALDIQANINYSQAGFLSPLSKVSYRIVWGYTDANSNLILGAQSSRVEITNFSLTESAVVDLEFTVPSEIETLDYFYQIYRSALATTDDINLLNEISSDDELRQVYEANVTRNDLITKTVRVTDIAPQSFQQSGTNLYTNAVSGEGVLASNAQPPFCKDIAAFKGSTFYANTRTKHKSQLTFLGTTGLTSKDISVISPLGSPATTLTLTSNAHGLSNGTNVAVVIPNSNPIIKGEFTVASATANTFDIIVPSTTVTDAVGAAWFSSSITIAQGVTNNRYYFVGKQAKFDILCDKDPTSGTLAAEDYFLANSIGNNTVVSTFLPAAVNTVDDTITFSAPHSLADNDRIKFSSTGTLPSGISSTDTYYTQVISATVIKLSTTHGPAFTTQNIVSTGSGVHTCTLATRDRKYVFWYNIQGIGLLENVQVFDDTYARLASETKLQITQDFIPSDVSVTTDEIALEANPFKDNDTVRFTTTGTLPSPLATGTDYYVISSTDGSLQISASYAGTAVDITTVGSGVHTIVRRDNKVKTAQQTAASMNSFLDFSASASIDFIAGNVSTGADTITLTNHGLSNDDRVMFVSSGTLPGGLDSISEYYIEVIDANTVKISTTAIASPTYVDLTTTGSTAAIHTALLNRIQVTLTNAGDWDDTVENTDLSDGTMGTGFAFTIRNSGYGEDAESNFIRLSKLPTPAQQVDDTARSIVKIINLNEQEVVSAFYLSGPEDLPGIFVLEAKNLDNTVFTVKANSVSVGNLFNPSLGSSVNSTADVSPNRVYYSKFNIPEAVPETQYFNVGKRDEEILRIIALRDSLFVLKTDGVFRISGQAIGDFSVSLFDSSTELIATDSACVLNNQIYGLTSQGVMTLSETGVGVISRPIENLLKKVQDYANFPTATFSVPYETDRAFILWTVTDPADTRATQCLRFNTFTQTWTNWDVAACSGSIFNDRLYIGAIDTALVEVERKDLARTDYADRQFILSIGNNALNLAENKVLLSSLNNVDVGDALRQTQYLSISEFNRLMRKLDNDMGPSLSDYSSIQGQYGDNITNLYSTFLTKLATDTNLMSDSAISSYVGSTVPSNDWSTLQTQYNSLMTIFNASTELVFSNYAASIGTKTYEMLITELPSFGNQVTVQYIAPFIVGLIDQFKSINTDIIWAPQTFGDPAVLKQVSTASMLFQNDNLYSIRISYATDLSPSYDEIDFIYEGSGVWGYFDWGNVVWGGLGTKAPLRTLIPPEKQRCRYIYTRFEHGNAFYKFAILGISFTPAATSERAYR